MLRCRASNATGGTSLMSSCSRRKLNLSVYAAPAAIYLFGSLRRARLAITTKDR